MEVKGCGREVVVGDAGVRSALVEGKWTREEWGRSLVREADETETVGLEGTALTEREREVEKRLDCGVRRLGAWKGRVQTSLETGPW